jgi:uncharacterized protein
MPLPISLTFAGVFALLNLWLAYRCVRIRVSGPGGVGDLGILVLRARMRAHANFVEYTPFVLILMALLEYAGGSAELLEGAGIVYLLARVLHAFGIERPRFTMQLIGAIGTWIVLLALAIWAIWTGVHGSMPIVIEPALRADGARAQLEHDPEKWTPVFPRDKRRTRLRGDHAQTTR